MPDDRGMLRPDESASVKDDDFTIESHSDPHAFDAVPADTTAGAEAEPVAKVTAPVVEAEYADESEDAIAAAADAPCCLAYPSMYCAMSRKLSAELENLSRLCSMEPGADDTSVLITKT